MLREIDVLLDDSTINEITGKILGAAIEVHRVLGPRLLESVYCVCLRYELAARGLQFTIQQHIPITYKEVALAASHRVDLFRIKA